MQNQPKCIDQANDSFAYDDPNRWEAMKMVLENPLAPSSSVKTVQEFPRSIFLSYFLSALLLAAILIIL